MPDLTDLERAVLACSRLRGTVLSDPAGTVDTMTELTETEQQVLAFERGRWNYSGAKDTAIAETFELSATRYYQLLGTIIDRPEALEAEPMVVLRLRRLRQQRSEARTRPAVG